MRRHGVKSWRRGPRVRMVPAGSREAIMVEEDEARRWQELAPRLGFCSACGATVDEANGKLHASDCPYLPPERRKAP